MDAVSAAASVLALIELAAKIGSVCVKYAHTVKHSKEDISRLQDEVQNLEQVLKRAQEIYQTSDDGDHIVEASTHQCLTRCKTQLAEILAKLEPTRLSRLGTRLKLDQLVWPLKKKEVDKLIDNLDSSKQSISLAIQIDQLAILKDIQISTSSVSLPIAEGASFDSFSDQLNARCHAKTRVALRQQIRDWFKDPNGTSIFWLSGMAGTGKSTILRSTAEEFYDQCQLGATFFFKRGEGARGDASRFFTTMASQLVQNVPELGVFIKEACKADPHIYDKAMREQFRRLIKEPIIKYEQGKHFPLLVVIDALDECEGEGDARLMIQLLAEIDPSPDKFLRLLLSSRPETPIRTTFGKLPDTKYISCTLHEIQDDIKQDIEVYLRDELTNIRKNSEYEIPTEWPTNQQISMLVAMAEPLFIAAATMCRFISDPRWDPERQLELMLSYSNVDHFSQLDVVYQPVLDQMLIGLSQSQKQVMLTDFQYVVGTVIILEDALSSVALAALLGVSRKFIASRLSMLHSVLRIPAQEDSTIRLLHLSFRDFLTMDARKGNSFWVDQHNVHQKTGQACLRLLLTTPCLKQDICDIGKPGIKRRAIKGDLISASIPPQVRYASTYWVSHICSGYGQFFDHHLIYDFLKQRFLYWVEALILLDHQSKVKDMLVKLQACCQDVNDPELKNFLRDAIDFMTVSGGMLDMCPLQFYSSALIFTSKQSTIRSIFEKEIPSWTNGLPHALDIHHNSSLIHTGFTYISSVALSPDNKQLASGFEDGSIKLWTTATGRLEHTLQSHEKRIEWVAYVQQGAWLASCAYSGESAIIMWNPKTGRVEQIIETEIGIRQACLSHDSQLLAICLRNDVVRVWDFSTGRSEDIIHAREGVHLTQFSADDGMLALASVKGGIEVVATSDGTQIGIFEAVTPDFDWWSLAFSPKDDLLAAGSCRRLWIWSIGSGQLVFASDKAYARRLMFFPDGSRLICLSRFRNEAAQIWDYLNNHLVTDRGYIWLAAFSIDGTRSAIVSEDGWAVVRKTSTAITERKFKTSWTGDGAIRFLDDAQHLVYHDYDRIELWDVDKGDLVHRIKSSVDKIYSTLLSSDGQYLASQAQNRKITVWNIASATLMWKFRSQGSLQSFSPMSLYLILRVTEGIELWSLSARDLHVRIPTRSNPYFEFLSNDSQLVIFDRDHRLSLWDTATGEQLDKLQDDMCLLVGTKKIFPNGRQLATADSKDTIRIWDLPTSTLLHTLFGIFGHVVGGVDGLFYSPSGDYILSLYEGELVRWNIDTTVRQWTRSGFLFHVGCTSFSKDGKYIAIPLQQHDHICILDAATGEMLQELKSPTWLREIQFSSDQQYLETDRGTLSLSQDVFSNPSLYRHVFFTTTWLTINGENMLWLPALHRPTDSAVHDGKIALAYGYSNEIVLYEVATGSCRRFLPGPEVEELPD